MAYNDTLIHALRKEGTLIANEEPTGFEGFDMLGHFVSFQHDEETNRARLFVGFDDDYAHTFGDPWVFIMVKVPQGTPTTTAYQVLRTLANEAEEGQRLNIVRV